MGYATGPTLCELWVLADMQKLFSNKKKLCDMKTELCDMRGGKKEKKKNLNKTELMRGGKKEKTSHVWSKCVP